MKFFVHVREKIIPIESGDGRQKAVWLSNVAIARYDKNFGRHLGIPEGLTREGGVMCDPNACVMDILEDGQHVFLLFKRDVDKRK